MNRTEEIRIRAASPDDAAELLAIYAPYVTGTAITFEYEVPGAEEFRERIRNTLKRYPYLAAVKNEAIVGYAYVSPFHKRAAYDWAVETSIYVRMGEHGSGIGTKLYQALEAVMRQQNIWNMNACIVYPHPESIGFHEHMGYRTVAHFTRCGYKLGMWHDVIWMEKLLGEHPERPEPVKSFSEEMLYGLNDF
ncbi:MAG: N-acetyltransferase [Lachnospiraceae bacterium]|nr:N-acetyltransferase [Lachnospiraceae bacterium]